MERIVIETEKETKEKLKDIARLRRVTMKQLLSDLIRNFLNKKRGGTKNATV